MSFKNALTKLGLVEDTVVTSVAPKAKATVATTSYVTPPTAPVIDEEISKILEQSLQESKLSGFDYLKFITATEEMKSFGTPEEGRFKMAFLAAKQVGVDKESLVKSGQHYLDVLKQDEDAFELESVQPENKSIQTKETKLTSLEAKITSLNEQLVQAKQDYADLTSDVQKKKAALEAKQATFKATLQTFVSNIEANVAKINKYLS